MFDLAISKPMKHFTILGQYRSNDNYQAILGNFLHILLHCTVYLQKYTNNSILSSNTFYQLFEHKFQFSEHVAYNFFM